MRWIQQDATYLLCNKLLSIRDERESWRCLQVRFSSYRGRHNGVLRSQFILRVLKEKLAEHEGVIYVCPDGDLFILFKGRVTPIVQLLSSHFADLNEDLLRHKKSDFFALHDFAKDWLHVFVMARRKLDREEQQESAGGRVLETLGPRA